MNPISILLSRFEQYSAAYAMQWNGLRVTYSNLLKSILVIEAKLVELRIENSVVSLDGDFSPQAIALLISLLRRGNTVALMTNRTPNQRDQLNDISTAQWRLNVTTEDTIEFVSTAATVDSPLLNGLISIADPGLIIFSSGSTGKPKGIVHRALPIIQRHLNRKKSLRTIAFLLFDHIGGINTLFYVLSNGGTLVIPPDRQPLTVADEIDRYNVQAITTSPTFLNLLLLSGAFEHHSFKSLQIINYSSEPMPSSTLSRLNELLPNVQLSQAYGLTETGVLPVRSMGSDSLWITFGNNDCIVRVVDGLLEVKSSTTMLGYLNDVSPFTPDGYIRTGDVVVREGDYFRILGRSTDLINVGGQKVYPAEIENALRGIPNVIDVMVSTENNAITGHVVKATFWINEIESLDSFKVKLRKHCEERLSLFQMPKKVVLTREPLHNQRYKKIRH